MQNNAHSYDVVVLGSGTSAYFAIDGLAAAGRKVAVVDERPYGGTCALRGCQPKKYLVSNAEAVAMSAHLTGRGIVAASRTDWQALQQLKNAFLDGRSEAAVAQWQKKGVVTYQGHAVLTGTNEVMVNNSHILKADHIVLATGATPHRTLIPGHEHVQDSESFLSLPELPGRILFIGGGYISFEFAHVAIRAGAEKVTILHRSQHPLKGFEPDMVQILIEAGRNDGIQVMLEESPVSITATGGRLEVLGTGGTVYEADLVIEATGRIPNLSALDGDYGKVKHSGRGVLVNEYLQSVSNPGVYAIGDCAASGPMLAPVADEEGKTVVRNILKGNVAPINYGVLPRAVFTIPSMGSVGITEAEAEQKGLDIRVCRGRTDKWPSSIRIGEKQGGYKVIKDRKTDTILGAHLVRHNAAEVINIFALAIKYGIPAADLADFLWSYPTSTSDIKYMVH